MHRSFCMHHASQLISEVAGGRPHRREPNVQPSLVHNPLDVPGQNTKKLNTGLLRRIR